MGIYDRDYYRDGSRGYITALVPEGRVCTFLIGVHVAAFVVGMFLQSEFMQYLTLQTSAVLEQGQIWRIFTFPFVHTPHALWSLAFSMVFLWWFGSDIEQMYGSAEFLIYYLLANVLGGLAFVGLAYVRETESIAFGPSGAITATLVLFACHFPSHIARVGFLLPMPIWLLVAVQILGSFYFDGDVLRNGTFVLNVTGALFAGLYYKKQWRLSGFLQ